MYTGFNFSFDITQKLKPENKTIKSLKDPGSSMMKKSPAEEMKKNLAELKNKAENL